MRKGTVSWTFPHGTRFHSGKQVLCLPIRKALQQKVLAPCNVFQAKACLLTHHSSAGIHSEMDHIPGLTYISSLSDSSESIYLTLCCPKKIWTSLPISHNGMWQWLCHTIKINWLLSSEVLIKGRLILHPHWAVWCGFPFPSLLGLLHLVYYTHSNKKQTKLWETDCLCVYINWVPMGNPIFRYHGNRKPCRGRLPPTYPGGEIDLFL